MPYERPLAGQVKFSVVPLSVNEPAAAPVDAFVIVPVMDERSLAVKVTVSFGLSCHAVACVVPGLWPALFLRPLGAILGSGNAVAAALAPFLLPLRITDAVRRGVVASEKGAWLATSETGTTINALVSADDKADLAKGACYNDTRVEVELA